MLGDSWLNMCHNACLYKTHGNLHGCEIVYKRRLIRRGGRGWGGGGLGGGGAEKEKGRKGEKGKGEKKKRKERKERKRKEIEKEEGGRRFLPQFIGVPTVGTRWTKK